MEYPGHGGSMKGRAFLLVFLMAMAPYLSTIDVVEATSGRAMACRGMFA